MACCVFARVEPHSFGTAGLFLFIEPGRYTYPVEAEVSSNSNRRQWIGTAASSLFVNPTLRDLQTLPLKGKFDVHDSRFRQVGGTNLYNLYGSQVSITGNTYRDSFEGMDMGYLVNTDYSFGQNEVLNISSPFGFGGVFLYGSYDSSTVSILGNTFTGVNGIFFDNTVAFSGDMKTQLLENAVEKDSGVGIYLSPGTRDCLIVCNSPADTVNNLGTDNKLVDCQQQTPSEAAPRLGPPNGKAWPHY